MLFCFLLLAASSLATLSDATCPRKEFVSVSGSQGSPGAAITRLDDTTLSLCWRTCRQYLHCQGVLVTWHRNARTTGLCQLLSAVLTGGSPSPLQGELYARCPLGMTYNSAMRGCYVFIAQRKNRTEAAEHCSSINTDVFLVEINSDYEQTFITRGSASAFTNITFWLGGIHVDGTQFKWEHSDEIFDYKYWAGAEPNVDPDKKYVAAHGSSPNPWLSQKDDYTYYFVCEYNF